MTPYPFAARIVRDLVVVQGPDATPFLQSLVSQDLDTVAVGASAPALLLQPQGKLLVNFDAHHHDTAEWWLLCENGYGDTLAAGLNRFKIRVKVETDTRPVDVFAVRGTEVRGETVVPVWWNGVVAFDVLDAEPSIDVPVVDGDAYDAARIEAGVPRLGVDVDERTIPQEAGLERDAVSFTKGCFVGQELVCRIDTRGHVNRTLRRLRGHGLVPGAEVLVGGRTVGHVTSSSADAALAMLRREVEPGERVDADGREATVEALA
jgi:folate-binding protein YgfZ